MFKLSKVCSVLGGLVDIEVVERYAGVAAVGYA